MLFSIIISCFNYVGQRICDVQTVYSMPKNFGIAQIIILTLTRFLLTVGNSFIEFGLCLQGWPETTEAMSLQILRFAWLSKWIMNDIFHNYLDFSKVASSSCFASMSLWALSKTPALDLDQMEPFSWEKKILWSLCHQILRIILQIKHWASVLCMN